MLQIKTKLGVVEGVLDSEHNVVFFGGIPYAAPPVGELRWKAPQPAETWDGVRKCDAFGNAAMQAVTPKMEGRMMCYGPEYFITEDCGISVSEDCLYLNVWAPANQAEEKRPVFVIIHGGGFVAGSGAVSVLNGRNLAKEGVIVVTINYRLGVFGYLCHPELSAESPEKLSGNYGLMDQIAALKWIKDNIAEFGGDPENITIAGESGGAMSVSLIYQAPMARGLFTKAVAQSGGLLDMGAFTLRTPLREREQRNAAAAAAAGFKTVEDLRKAPAEALLTIPEKWEPVLDGYYWGAGKERNTDVPVLLGSNSDEGLIFTYGITEEAAIESLKQAYGEHYQAIYDLYSREAGFPEWLQSYYRDTYFGYQMFSWAKQQATSGTKPAYLYYFDRAVPEVGFGAFHTSELEYFYDNRRFTNVAWEAVDEVLSDKMKRYLLNFIRRGDPNGEDLVRWEPFQKDMGRVMELGEQIGMIRQPHMQEMQLHETIKAKE